MPNPTIDPEFRDLIPPLAPDERALLEASIVAEGVREPLIVWPVDGAPPILIDGHNRFNICQRHGIPFPTRGMAFPDRDAATRWIIENQMGRRNLSAYARSVLALRLKDAYTAQAKVRQGTRTDLAANIGENSPRCRTAARLSRLAGVSDHTLKRAAYLDAHAPPALKKELLAGATSINAAFMALRRDTKQRDHRALIAATPPFPTGTYGTLLLDPPWAYRQRSGPHGAIDQYPTMTTAELAALPVNGLAAEDAVLLLWATWPLLPDALALIAAWGFTYKSALPWVKVFGEPQPDAPLRPHWGTGFWVRACSEPLLIATRGAARPPANPHLGLLSHRFEHSRKPESAYELAEQFGGPYVELFARGEARPGWTAWGAEVTTGATDNAVAADD